MCELDIKYLKCIIRLFSNTRVKNVTKCLRAVQSCKNFDKFNFCMRSHFVIIYHDSHYNSSIKIYISLKTPPFLIILALFNTY